ncbi:hypothetical protein KKF59_01635 [Patescibacteria group bacterium]|nr:hypothetical protein [Patescibacteria group bacterium]MBU1034665.1 hypothetical protein [Patescibacteria group bacterium]MBU1629558.1 hypothetical protein [Patescibacteria group bacterium]MBU1907815.1 hypothetical protein [Patescibacteria group bacterium]
MKSQKLWQSCSVIICTCLLLTACGIGAETGADNSGTALADGAVRDETQSNERASFELPSGESKGDEPAPCSDFVPAAYATQIQVTAACSQNIAELSVAKGHATETECEHLIPTAKYVAGNCSAMVAVPTFWLLSDPDNVGLSIPLGQTDGSALLLGKKDIFDLTGDFEPESWIVACAHNQCPQSGSQDCEEKICDAVKAVSVVNLEGAWVLESPLMEDNLNLSLQQDGRRFRDGDIGLDRGRIQGASVSFEIDDYLYSGIIKSNRQYMGGSVEDLMVGNYMGEWSAERLP